LSAFYYGKLCLLSEGGNSRTDNLPNPEQRAIVGVVVGAHGRYGEVKVKSFSDNDERFFPSNKMIICDTIFEITKSRNHKGLVLIKFMGVDDPSLAQRLIGSNLEVPMADIPDLPQGFFYHFEILGLAVVDKQMGLIGQVVDILNTGSNDVYVVDYSGKEILIPAIKSVILAVDVKNHLITVDLPNGLV
tara:strand:+ start:5201 stop:5767 length:567 start_codon:yes stop_codon:yes gene_type:complete